ncbi:uncharacterized protein SAMN00017405_2266 [Desulfonispora thiosulfatigenes DSM 11270]|uniref:TPM domain-containing protein n=1 Tax=Desulfonispora thiosulfatigenes DSM 11270 TaxID=656914 RepID=A0A1W1VCV6_DESTI|nr:TPM domain-containing protein [Desulfonispora thiosulfatigenes]SMB91277.1 uncharacterized protein SAMN00017405_2266 [Desulfonispora thiosulfatigenes DSM 11270]
MNKKIKILFVTFLILTFFTNVAYALTLPNYTGDIYVQDFAEMISPELETEINNISRSLEDQTTAQIAVVTIPSLEGNDIELYANELLRKWAIGSKEKDNGVLVLIAKEEKDFRIEVGYGLEGRINDAKAGDILRAATPSFKAGNNDEGVSVIYSSLIQEISAEYEIDINNLYPGTAPETGLGTEKEAKLPFWAKALFVIVLIYLAIFHPDVLMMLIYMFSRGGGGSGGNSGGSRRGGGGSSGGGGASGGW